MEKPLAYVNLTTMDVAIGFYLNKIPDGYQPVFPVEYVNELIEELKATKSRLDVSDELLSAAFAEKQDILATMKDKGD